VALAFVDVNYLNAGARGDSRSLNGSRQAVDQAVDQLDRRLELIAPELDLWRDSHYPVVTTVGLAPLAVHSESSRGGTFR
jgi:hypothetical protein